MQEGVSLRRSIWVSSLITLVVLAVFIGLAALIPRPDEETLVLVLGLFLALIPALVWMGFFYQQDRSEPEPKRLVARMFVFGALAAAVAVPAGNQLIGQAIDQYSNIAIRLVLTILSLSLLQETLKVAMVRYVVLGTNDFDRHPDGIVYGLASGLGFATVLTVAYVLRSEGVIPLAGAIRAVDNALVHGALGAVSGYYIGRVKIDGKKLGWMASGLAIVTGVNGVYQIATAELSSRLVFNPWLSLVAAAGIAVVVGVVLFAFFRRAMKRATGEMQTVSLQIHARSKDMPWDIHVRYDYLLIGALILALVVGWGAGLLAHNRTVVYSDERLSVSFRYPSGWAVQVGGMGRVSIRDLTSPGMFKPILTVIDEKAREGYSLDFLVAQRVATDEQQNPLYTELRREVSLTVGGMPAIQIEYQYATDTGNGPAVVRALETYTAVGSRLYIFRYEAQPDAFEEGLVHYERLLHSVKFETE